MPGGASVISISYFVPVQGAVWVINVIDGGGLLTRRMWGMRTEYVPIGRYSTSAVTKGGANRSTSCS